MPIKIGNITITVLVDSGSACIILSRSLASQVVKSSKGAFQVHEKASPQLMTFSNEPIHIERKMQSPITSKGWTFDSATFTVVAHCLKSLIGRDLFDQLILAVTQSSSHKGNLIKNISSSSEFKKQIAITFPNLVSRIGRYKNHVAKSNFLKEFQPRYQKGRRIPINLQDKVNNELKKLLDEKHIIKLSSLHDKYFISPIVVTVKKDQTTKPALDSKILNEYIYKNKYQMPNIDTLIESISQQISAPASQNTTCLSTLDLKYTWSANLCLFSTWVSGWKDVWSWTVGTRTSWSIDTLSTAEFWKIVEKAFIRPRNITLNRHVFLITKQLRGETVEHFYGKLIKIAENSDFENKEETLIRDAFVTNLIRPEFQKEHLKQTVEPRQALEIVINMETGMRYEHQIRQHNKTIIPAGVNVIQFPNSRTPNWSNSKNLLR